MKKKNFKKTNLVGKEKELDQKVDEMLEKSDF